MRKQSANIATLKPARRFQPRAGVGRCERRMASASTVYAAVTAMIPRVMNSTG